MATRRNVALAALSTALLIACSDQPSASTLTEPEHGVLLNTSAPCGINPGGKVAPGQARKCEETPPDTGSTSPPPPSDPSPAPPPPPSGSYSATSPHWPHIRTMVTDFYHNWTSALRDTAAQRFDMVIGGNVNEWTQRNATVKQLPYMLHWNIIQDGSYTAFANWYSTNFPNRNIEEAFLHKAGTSKTLANRLSFHIWTTQRYAFNPNDPGWRSWQRQRIQQARAAGSAGVFYDEYGTSTLSPARISLEFGTADQYYAALEDALKSERSAFPGAVLMLNTAEYISSWDERMIIAAGGTHLEMFNDLLHGDAIYRLQFVERLLANGAVVEIVGRRNWLYGLPSSVTRGNYRDATLDGFVAPGMYRQKMGELTAYYLSRPTNPSNYYFDTNNDNWHKLPTAHWLAAQAVDVGHPLESRQLIISTVGADGQNVRVWRREYSNALILVRPSADWNDSGYGDASGHTVTFPRTYRILQHDGSVSATVDRVVLRKGEGVILMK